MNKQRIHLFPVCCLLGGLMLLMFLQGCNSGAVSAIAPNATFTASTYAGSFPLNVIFNATASTDSDGRITQYDWNFGDGTTGNGSIIGHTYSNIGSFTVQLTVTDDGRNTGSYSATIEVKPRYTISGRVTPAGYLETDSDVNDTNASYSPNDSFNEAQEVSAPVSISGYVNLALNGYPGRSFSTGDPEDYYHVTLNRGTDITLYMTADPASSELNLYLYDDQQNLIDGTYSTTDDNGLAFLTAPEDGNYFIRIEAADLAPLTTASVYLLNMGKTGLSISRHVPRLSDDFVPGEVLVQFEEQASLSLSGFDDSMNSLSSMGLYTLSKTSNRDKLWRRSRRIDKSVLFGQLGIQSALAASLAPGKADPTTVSKLETLWMIRALGKRDDIRIAEPNYIRKRLITEPNDPYYSYQWHYPLIGLPEAWDITTGSSDVVVADIDTGILKEHPDLQGQIVDGYDFVSDPNFALDGDGVDPDPEDPGDGGVGGSSFHGTHTAGTIAALSNNNVGVAGIAWNAKIMPLRALGARGTGTSSDILEAVKYAAGLQTDAGVQLDSPVDVINLSLGGTSYSQIEEEVYQQARDQGVIIVASAGNDGTNEISYPAGYGSVVSVSAVTIDGTLAGYSNFGTTIDVAAPGGSSTDQNGDGYMDGVLSTVGDDSSGTLRLGYAFYIGTSMAAPHVAGVAALMKALYPDMTPDRFDALLAGGYLTQDNNGAGWNDQFGYGLINAYKAVLVAKQLGVGGEIPAILSVSPRTLNFGSFLSSLDVNVENSGEGSLNLDGYSSDASWLSITPSANVDENGLGSYTVNVIREGLADGIYTATLTFEAGVQQVRVAVNMQVGSGSGMADGGFHYILLLDAATKFSVQEYDSAGENGFYDFSFSGLSYNHSYYLYAGTDPNDDAFICGEGEICGAYLSLDQPVKLTILENMEGLDFTTDIRINIPHSSSNQLDPTTDSLQRDVRRKFIK